MCALWRCVAVLLVNSAVSRALLHPRDTPSREVKELNGVWSFRADTSPGRHDGFQRQWYKSPLSMVRRELPSTYSPHHPSSPLLGDQLFLDTA